MAAGSHEGIQLGLGIVIYRPCDGMTCLLAPFVVARWGNVEVCLSKVWAMRLVRVERNNTILDPRTE